MEKEFAREKAHTSRRRIHLNAIHDGIYVCIYTRTGPLITYNNLQVEPIRYATCTVFPPEETFFSSLSCTVRNEKAFYLGPPCTSSQGGISE